MYNTRSKLTFEVQAKVKRKNGTIENLGTIATTKKNVKNLIKEIKNERID